MILGVFGPFQILIIAVLPIAAIVGLILLFVSRAKHKTEVEMLKAQLAEKRRKSTGPIKLTIHDSNKKQPEPRKETQPKMTSDEALAELKRAKDKLDVGLITQEEFSALRAKLGPLVD